MSSIFRSELEDLAYEIHQTADGLAELGRKIEAAERSQEAIDASLGNRIAVIKAYRNGDSKALQSLLAGGKRN